MVDEADTHIVNGEAERIYALTRPDDKLFTLYLIYSVLANVAFLFVFPPLYFRFKTLRYRFDAEGVSVSHGLLWRKETYLTYARIQDIHVTRNIFERWLGIGTVEIQTAAGSASPEEAITGIREFNEVRDFLYARMRGHRLTSHKANGTAPAAANGILTGIRDDLQAIRHLLEDRPHV